MAYSPWVSGEAKSEGIAIRKSRLPTIPKIPHFFIFFPPSAKG